MNNGARLDSTGQPLNAAAQGLWDSFTDDESAKLAREDAIQVAVASLDWHEAVRIAEVGDDFPALTDDEHERVSTMLARDGLDLDDHRVIRRRAPRSAWDSEGPATLVDAPALALVDLVDAEDAGEMLAGLRAAS